jgi:hypothetical protein
MAKVEEYLPSKHKALSSNPMTIKRKRKVERWSDEAGK